MKKNTRKRHMIAKLLLSFRKSGLLSLLWIQKFDRKLSNIADSAHARYTDLAETLTKCSTVAEISLSGKNAKSSMTQVRMRIVLKFETPVHCRCRN